MRVLNASPDPTTATVDIADGPASGWIVDLIGRPRQPFDGAVDLGPWEIATLRLV